MSHSKGGTGKGRLVSTSRWLFAFALVMGVSGAAVQNARAATRPKHQESNGATETLMFVRRWDPGSGELIGWLPMHKAEIHLRSLVPLKAEFFDPQEVVKILWGRRPKRTPQTGELMISPWIRNFNGKDWVPAQQCPNVIEIKKRFFLVETIVFVDAS